MAQERARALAGRAVVPLLLLTFALLTVDYRIELGPVSLLVAEPAILLTSAALLLSPGADWRAPFSEPLLWIVATLVALAALLAPLGESLTAGLSDIRDWALPLLLVGALVASPRVGWRTVIPLFIAVAYVTAWLGLFQVVTDGFRPFMSELAGFKRGISSGGEIIVGPSLAVGLFGHPNSYAIFMFAGVMLAIGWLDQTRRRLPVALLVVVPMVAALALSYAKTSLAVMVAVFALWALVRGLRSRRLLGGLVATGAVGAVALVPVTLATLPFSLTGTLWWRLGLWDLALVLLRDQPRLLLMGNGLGEFARSGYHAQPHNTFLHLFLAYGIAGFALLALLVIEIWRTGWRAHGTGLMQRAPMLAALWAGLLGLFAIGLLESVLLGLGLRTIVLLMLGAYAGVLRQAEERESVPYVAPASARAHAL